MTATATRTPKTDAAPTGMTSMRRAGLIAGIGYVVLFTLGIFANFFVREGLVVAGDAAATAANIIESESLFRIGLVSFLAIFLVDVVVAWALYIVFRESDRDLSLLTAWFRIVYTVFLGVAIVFFFQALQLLSGAAFLASVDTAALEAQALVAVDAFNSTWLIGLAGFGIHVVLLGALVLRSGLASRILGYVLITAGAAYVLDTIAHALLGNYSEYESLFVAIVAIPAVIAEGWFGLWLLVRAGKDRTLSTEVPV